MTTEIEDHGSGCWGMQKLFKNIDEEVKKKVSEGEKEIRRMETEEFWNTLKRLTKKS